MVFDIKINQSRGNTSVSNGKPNPSKPVRSSVYEVQKGDNLSIIAKKFGMTPDEFCKWTKFNKNKVLHIGDKIPGLTCVTLDKGSTLSSLVNKYDMDIAAFCAMNGMTSSEFNTHRPKAGVKFYVWKGYKKGNKKNSPVNQHKPQQAQSSTKTKNPTKTIKTTNTTRTQSTNNTNSKTQTTASFRVAQPNESVRIIGVNKKPPIPKDKNGNITAEVIKFNPKQPNSGELKGKTIMVNAGHGWKTNGAFDIGAPGTDINGHEIDEWRKNRDFAQNLIQELTAKGATVIFTAGHAQTVCDAKSKYKSDAFISLHCNASPDRSKKGLDVFYMTDNVTGKNFANIIGKKLRAQVKGDKESGRSTIGVLRRENQTPSILIELGFLTNKHDQLNIDSFGDRQKKMKLVADGIVEMLNSKK